MAKANDKKPKTDRAPRQTKVDPNETKGAKFIRLAKARAANAIKHLRNLGKLGTPAYERTPEQVKKLTGQLQDELNAAMERLAQTKVAAKESIEVDL